jgi:CRISPR-associated protein Csd1
MLLEALVKYAEVELGADLPPAGYQKQPIRYIIALSSNGQYQGPILDTASKDAPRGEQRLGPHVKRSVGISPKVLADTGEYVLGIPRNDPKNPPKPDRVAEQHRQFVEMVETCARDTGEPSVQAVATFLTGGSRIPEADLIGFDASQTVTFRVGGTYPIDLQRVRAWWANQRSAPAVTVKTRGTPVPQDTCMVCGEQGPVLKVHPLKIKGIPGGQIQKDLISANARAFESYGLSGSQIAPTCARCAEAYGNALNALLADRSTSIWTGNLAYAFWVQAQPKAETSQDPFAPVALMTRPQEHSSEVREMMKTVFSGNADAVQIDPRRFYSVALGASGARVVVKDWIDTTVGEARERIVRYFQCQELVDWNGSEGQFLPFNWIANSTVHEKGTPVPQVGKSLIRLAFAGDPLPMELLHLAVRRNRAEQAVNRARAVLIKVVLCSRGMIPMEEPGVMVGLNPDDSHPAYQCGRLLETLNQIQYAALGKTNTTVVSRYYGTASASPQTVFPNLIRLSGAHLRRMQRDSPAAHHRLERQLNEIMARLDGSFPKMFNAEDQGRFALGFYHQRAQRQRELDEARAKREAGKQAASDLAVAELEELSEEAVA